MGSTAVVILAGKVDCVNLTSTSVHRILVKMEENVRTRSVATTAHVPLDIKVMRLIDVVISGLIEQNRSYMIALLLEQTFTQLYSWCWCEF